MAHPRMELLFSQYVKHATRSLYISMSHQQAAHELTSRMVDTKDDLPPIAGYGIARFVRAVCHSSAKILTFWQVTVGRSLRHGLILQAN